jgi:glucokinase
VTVIGVDVGGSGIKAAAFRAGLPDRAYRIPTPQGDPTGTAVADAVALAVREAAGSDPVTAVGLAAPGVVDDEEGRVVRSTNLGWEGVPLRDLVAERLGLAVAFGHDVRLGGLAEFESGAGRGHADAMFAPIGTGISLAIRSDGRMLSAGGWAGEIGMGRLVDGTLEEVASASGLARRLGEPDGASVVARVRAGQPAAVAAWELATDALAAALSGAVLTLGSRCVVVGGGLSLAGDLLLDPLRAGIAARLGEFPPPVVVAGLFGDLAACHGAALLAHRAAG